MPVETIVAAKHSDYGVLLNTPGGKDWMNGSDKMPRTKAEWQKLIPVGKPVVVEYVVTQNGAKRITAIVSAGVTNSGNPPPTKAAESIGVPSGPTHYGRPLSDYEKEKDVRIHVSGILQAVIASPAVASISTDAEVFEKNVKELTTKFLAFAQETVASKNK